MFLNGSILEAYFFEKSICTEFVALGHVFGCFLLCLQDSMFETPSSSYSEIVPMPTSDIESEYIFCWIKNPKVLAPHPKTCPQEKNRSFRDAHPIFSYEFLDASVYQMSSYLSPIHFRKTIQPQMVPIRI